MSMVSRSPRSGQITCNDLAVDEDVPPLGIRVGHQDAGGRSGDDRAVRHQRLREQAGLVVSVNFARIDLDRLPLGERSREQIVEQIALAAATRRHSGGNGRTDLQQRDPHASLNGCGHAW